MNSDAPRFQSALVLGLGASGEAAARLLLGEGTRVVVADAADTDRLRDRAAALQALGAEVRLGHSALPPGGFEVCVVSPGIPLAAPTLRAARARGIPLLSELELGWSRARSRVLAVTGSNGKSTLATLCADALARANRRAALAGNYGPPACAVARAGEAPDWLVLEVSSFQLETVSAFRPNVGVLLNLSPNHLDRHGDMPAYRALKARLFARMRAEDTAATPVECLAEVRGLAGSAARWVGFGRTDNAAFRYRPGWIEGPAAWRAPIGGTLFDNDVMGLTAAAAAAALWACGIGAEALSEAARAFEPLPHRLQPLGMARGVRFVDDSKATSLAALMAALAVTPPPVRLIAGGRPKGESYEPARALLAEKAASAYLIGESAPAMAAAWQDITPCTLCGTIEEAVAAAWRDAQSGDTILLSPGAASFDQFPGFAARGSVFARAVRAVAETA